MSAAFIILQAGVGQINFRPETRTEELMMRLFAPDLYRDLTVGFALGAIGVVGLMASDGSSASELIAPPANAAQTVQSADVLEVQVSEEFVIVPQERAL